MRSVVRSKSFSEHLHHSLSPCPPPSWGLSCRLQQPVDPLLKVICSCLNLNSQLARGCSQWADRIGYSVFFLYLQLHRRYFLVPKNCLLALSQRAAVSISTIRFSSACWNSGLYLVALPSLSPAAQQQGGFPSFSCLVTPASVLWGLCSSSLHCFSSKLSGA